MDLEKLSARAMEIRRQFAAFEQGGFGREWTREEIMQGFLVDVGDLMRIVMAKSGIRHVDDVDRKLEHELSDCLWCVLVLSKLYGVDLERAFARTMDELEVWIAQRQRRRRKKTAAKAAAPAPATAKRRAKRKRA